MKCYIEVYIHFESSTFKQVISFNRNEDKNSIILSLVIRITFDYIKNLYI